MGTVDYVVTIRQTKVYDVIIVATICVVISTNYAVIIDSIVPLTV